MFKNRTEAGKLWAGALDGYKSDEAVVLALPRGGVAVGYEVALILNLPLDILVTRKIGHPDNPEYAVGAVDENGAFLLGEADIGRLSQDWLNEAISRGKYEAGQRVAFYRGHRTPQIIKGKTAIIV